MSTAAKKGYGTTLAKGGTSVGEIRSLTYTGMKADSIEVTTFASADNCKEFIAGMVDGGEIKAEVNLLAATTTLITTDMLAGTVATWTVTWGGSVGSVAASMFVTGFEPSATPTGESKASITLKITGKPTCA